MIVPMQRLTLICLSSAREATLRTLQDMGVVHITSLKPPDSRALETARNHLAYIKRVLETLPRKTSAAPTGTPADAVVSLVWTMLQDQKDLEESLAEVRQERARLAPFGLFDPGMITALRQRGIYIKLYSLSAKVMPKVPDGATLIELRRDADTVYSALFALEDVQLEVPEFRLPAQGLRELDETSKEIEARLADCRASLSVHEGDYEPVAHLRDQMEDKVRFLEARDGMGSAAPVAYLRGYVPASQSDALFEVARREGWGVQLEEPGPDEEVPTQIVNPAWIKPIETVLKGINVLPGYRETDMSAAFLVFFSLFFAILIGDAGYGLLFLLGVRYARRTCKDAPPEPFRLLALTSVCTIIWGVITGTYFGAAAIPPVLEGLRIDWLTDTNNMMSLCFLIGAIHLTIAHGWNIVRMFPSLQALAQLGWIGMTWTMYFVAHMLVLNQGLPGVIPWLATIAAALILAFMTPREKFKDEWFNHVMFPLNVVSNFVDVVSYIRLFAVGFASLAVAQAFNAMAMGSGISGPFAALGAALILLLGHTLNIVLGAMGILVHGVRLNTLEFSSHLGVQWTGHAYEPFAKKRK